MLSTLCARLWLAVAQLKDDARGISALEYAVLLAIVLVVIVAGLGTLTNGINEVFESGVNALNTAAAGG
ncbi:Flp family type IVb pilin [Castellaniella hirudinis]|uniref:Flp family type IVb pilin n=1 Tax=Castellaniella hirudinis TaxID=1144617 RepID=UPI0039C020EC